jgi:hypothetical protein
MLMKLPMMRYSRALRLASRTVCLLPYMSHQCPIKKGKSSASHDSGGLQANKSWCRFERENSLVFHSNPPAGQQRFSSPRSMVGK